MTTTGGTRGLVACAIAAIAVGISVMVMANLGPFNEIENNIARGPTFVKQSLGLKSSAGTYASVFGSDPNNGLSHAWNAATDVFWVLILFFKNLLSERCGRGEVLNIGVAALPLITSMFVEALRDSNNTPALVVLFAGILLVGQVATMGATFNLLYVPFYAWYRLRQARVKAIAPYASPAPLALYWLQATLVLFNVIGFLTTFYDVNKPAWIASNIAFQFYPIIFLPLALWPLVQKTLRPKPANQDKVQLINLYNHWSLLGFAGYLVSMYLMWYELKSVPKALWYGRHELLNYTTLFNEPSTYLASLHKLVIRGGVTTDGQWLLFFDLIGVSIAEYLLVLIDTFADNLQIAQTKIKRVHPPRTVHEDLILESFTFVFFGPGWLYSKYLALRETASSEAAIEDVKNKAE